MLPALERAHDVLAITQAGHAGGPEIAEVSDQVLADAVEAAMDAAGWETAHVAGNSLGGFVALQLAERGRARSVVALAPAGGWADRSHAGLFELQASMHETLKLAAVHADAIAATPEGRRRATSFITVNREHIPPGLIANLIRGAAGAVDAPRMLDYARSAAWSLDPERITCPVRIVWGTEDRLLPWPSAAARFHQWVPQAEWVTLDGVGHCPQLDVPSVTAELIAGFSR